MVVSEVPNYFDFYDYYFWRNISRSLGFLSTVNCTCFISVSFLLTTGFNDVQLHCKSILKTYCGQ